MHPLIKTALSAALLVTLDACGPTFEHESRRGTTPAEAGDSRVGEALPLSGGYLTTTFPKTYYGNDRIWIHSVGRAVGSSWVAEKAEGYGGVAMGPYASLPAGLYRITFNIGVDALNDDTNVCASVDVRDADTNQYPTFKELTCKDLSRTPTVSLMFTSNGVSRYEFRFITRGLRKTWHASTRIDSFTASPNFPMTLYPTDPVFGHQAGSAVGTDWSSGGVPSSSYLAYGPYLPLPETRAYGATFVFGGSKAIYGYNDYAIATYDVRDAQTGAILASADLKKEELSHRGWPVNKTLTFNNVAGHPLEYRVLLKNSYDEVILKSVSISPR